MDEYESLSHPSGSANTKSRNETVIREWPRNKSPAPAGELEQPAALMCRASNARTCVSRRSDHISVNRAGEGEFEAAGGLIGEPSSGLPDGGAIIVENQLDRRIGRIGGRSSKNSISRDSCRAGA
jgi:hypothetical protein